MRPETDGEPDRREALFGGVGTVKVWDLLSGGSAPPFTAVLACELDAGGRVGRHLQQRDPEIVVCTSGQGSALVDGQPHPMVTGSVVHLPLGSTLEIVNEASDRALGYLIIKARA